MAVGAPAADTINMASRTGTPGMIELQKVAKVFGLGMVEVPVLQGVSLSIQRDEMVAVIGASGSGKSTLMNILGCLDVPTSGRYFLEGEDAGQFSDETTGRRLVDE